MALDRGRLDSRVDDLIFSFHEVPGGEETYFMWRYGRKKLVIYTENDGTLPYYIRVPIYNDPSCKMTGGDITSIDDAILHWKWLVGEDNE